MKHQFSFLQKNESQLPAFESDLLIGLNESLTESENKIFNEIEKGSYDFDGKRPMITDIKGETAIWTLVPVH